MSNTICQMLTVTDDPFIKRVIMDVYISNSMGVLQIGQTEHVMILRSVICYENWIYFITALHLRISS